MMETVALECKDGAMPKHHAPYPVELAERAVRVVLEHQHEYPSQ
jgi:hypothetical protein